MKPLMRLRGQQTSTPGDAKAYYNLGIIYAERGNDGDAITQYRRALHLARTNPDLQELIPEIEGRIKALN